MPQSWDMGQILYFPSEGRNAEDFYTRKNPTASAGFDPANLGTRGQYANHYTTEAVKMPPMFGGCDVTHIHILPDICNIYRL
jgi:hypothetical protein